jgi:hypothetical protein
VKYNKDVIQQAQPITPVIVQVVEAPTRETGVVEVLMGAIGLTGVLLLTALVLGLVCGAVFVALRKIQERRGRVHDDRFARLNLGPSPIPDHQR